MRRFITYLYEYTDGEKRKNTGFIRTDIRGNVSSMGIHVKNSNRMNTTGTVYFIVRTDDNAFRIPMGDIILEQGTGDALVRFENDDIHSWGVSFHQIEGVGIEYENGNWDGSNWRDDSKGNFKPQMIPLLEEMPKEYADDAESGEQESTNLPLEIETVLDEREEEPAVWQMESVTEQADYERITVNDIKKLPKEYWYLCNNSFLLHGYFNYHYLILKRIRGKNERLYIGVPGIYERPEKVMANVFGFREFEQADQEEKKKTGNAAFGYWLCLLHTQELNHD